MDTYRIIYMKTGHPATSYRDNKKDACELAQRLAQYGYSVSLWELNDEGCKKIEQRKDNKE